MASSTADIIKETWPKLLKVFGVTDYETASGGLGDETGLLGGTSDLHRAYEVAMSKLGQTMRHASCPPWEYRCGVFSQMIKRDQFNAVLGLKDPINTDICMTEFYEFGVFSKGDGNCNDTLFERLSKAIYGKSTVYKIDPVVNLDNYVGCEGGTVEDFFKAFRSKDAIQMPGLENCVLPCDESDEVGDDGYYMKELGKHVAFSDCRAVDCVKTEDGKYVFNLGTTCTVPRLDLFNVAATRNYGKIDSMLSKVGVSSRDEVLPLYQKANAEYVADKSNPAKRSKKDFLFFLYNAIQDTAYMNNLLSYTGIVGAMVTSGLKQLPALPDGHHWVCLLGALNLGNWTALRERLNVSKKK